MTSSPATTTRTATSTRATSRSGSRSSVRPAPISRPTAIATATSTATTSSSGSATWATSSKSPPPSSPRRSRPRVGRKSPPWNRPSRLRWPWRSLPGRRRRRRWTVDSHHWPRAAIIPRGSVVPQGRSRARRARRAGWQRVGRPSRATTGVAPPWTVSRLAGRAQAKLCGDDDYANAADDVFADDQALDPALAFLTQ